MICGNCGYINDRRNTLTNVVSYQYCMQYSYRLEFLICMCPPVNIHCHGLYYACLVCVCLNRWMHTSAPAFINYFTHAHTRTRIHSFFLTLTRGKTLFSHNQILINPISYGLVHDVCVKKICVFCTVLFFFPNNLPRMSG